MWKRRISALLVFALLLAMLGAAALAVTEDTQAHVTEISTGDKHSLLVKSDGTLWASGDNLYGNFGDGTTESSFAYIEVMRGVAHAAAGANYSLIVKTDKSLWAVGYNANGQLGDGTKENRKTPVKIMDDVAAVTCGGSTAAAIKTDGTLWMWGGNSAGQLGDGTKGENRLSPVKVLDNAASVSTSGYHTLAVKTNGSLWAWGANNCAQLGDGTTTNQLTPTPIMEEAVMASAGDNHSLILLGDGSLLTCGRVAEGQTGTGVPEEGVTTLETPTKIMDDVAYLSTGYQSSMIVRRDGTLWACGYNAYGQLGDGTMETAFAPVKIMDGAVRVSTGGHLYGHTLVLKNDGTVWASGDNRRGQLGDGTDGDRLSPIELMQNVASVSAGNQFSLLRKQDHTLWLLGEGNAVPVQIDSDVVSASAGDGFFAYVKSDGTLWVNGNNYYGQLGTGDTADVPAPMTVMDGAAEVFAGQNMLLIRKQDETLWGCGDNSYGDLFGDEIALEKHLTPVKLMDDVASVAVHGNASNWTVAAKTDGTYWGWGHQMAFEQLPEQWSSFYGGAHQLVLQTDGILLGAGRNTDGELGDGTGESLFEGTIEVSNNVKEFSVGSANTFVLKNDNSLWVTGNNAEGQLGIGSYENQLKFKKLMDNVSAVDAGASHTLVLKADGTAWGFGSNQNAQLGDGGAAVREFVQVFGEGGDVMLEEALLGEYIYGVKLPGVDGLHEKEQEIQNGRAFDEVFTEILESLTPEQKASSVAKDDMALFAEVGLRLSRSQEIGESYTLEASALREIAGADGASAQSLDAMTAQYDFALSRDIRSGITLDSTSARTVAVEFGAGLGDAGAERVTVSADYAAFTSDASGLDSAALSLRNLNPPEEEEAPFNIFNFWGILALALILSLWFTVGRHKLPGFVLPLALALVLLANGATLILGERNKEVPPPPDPADEGYLVEVQLSGIDGGLLSLPVSEEMGESAFLVVVNDEGEQVFSKYNHVTNTVDARVAQSGRYTVVEQRVDFSDIENKSAEMREAIELLASKGLMDGTSPTEFSPDDPISRAEFISTVLLSMDLYDINAENVFDDVSAQDWFYAVAASAYQEGLVQGIGGNKFDGLTTIPKDQMVVIAARTLVKQMGYHLPAELETLLARYADSAELAEWSMENIALATRESLVHYRIDDRFAPKSAMTRGDAAIILYRLFMKMW